jgi:hypothetical protein
MICSRCGCDQVAGARFCRQCGLRFDAAPPPPYDPYYAMRTRVSQHLQPLAILWFVFGAVRLITGLVAALTLDTMSREGLFQFGDAPLFVPHLFHALVPVIVVGSSVMGAAALLVGWSLINRKPWARTLAIVIGIIELLKFPLGTALGIYTLWVLAPSASGYEWRGLQQAER